MRYIGVHCGHDTSLVVLSASGNVELFAQAERFHPREKKGWALPPVFHAFPGFKVLPDDVVVFVAVNMHQESDLRGYDPKLVQRTTGSFVHDGEIEIPGQYMISHHIAHVFSSWCFRPDDKPRMFIAYDGVGPDANHKALRHYLVGKITSTGFSANYDSVDIASSIPVGGILGYDSAGKAMGLAGYKVDAPKLEWTDENVLKILTMCRHYKPANGIVASTFPCLQEPLNEKNMDFVAGFYKWVIDQIWKGVKGNIEKFNPQNGVVVSGGTSLALELNTKIHDMAGSLVFGPAVNDCGLALGAAVFGYFHRNNKWPQFSSASLMSLQKRLPKVGPQEPELIADKLAEGIVVGLLRGKAEIGPRSLGFRSILANAGDPNNLKLVSQDIKEREFYRPLAPIVTAEQFRFFDGPKGEYMQYRVMCNEEARRLLPVVVHRDLSSRPQVVYKDKDPWMHRLLVRYGELTGVECLVNTSLNKAGKPICNTYEDAQEDMKGKPVELISIAHPAHRFSHDYEEPKIYA